MIILGATPIGNLSDASPRLVAALEQASLVVCEDTRVTSKLIHGLGIVNRPQLVSMHEHNESKRVAAIVERAREDDVLVVSDAGMPTVSDPGFELVRSAVESGVTVTVIPGPSAVLSALAVSGLPSDRFAFEGFLARSAGDRQRTLEALAREPRTLIFFESPHRIAQTLRDMGIAFGEERRAVVCRELTKRFEEVVRGSLAELSEWANAPKKGEIVIVVAGATPTPAISLETAANEVLRLVVAGESMKDAVATLARLSGLSRRDVYRAALSAREALSDQDLD